MGLLATFLWLTKIGIYISSTQYQYGAFCLLFVLPDGAGLHFFCYSSGCVGRVVFLRITTQCFGTFFPPFVLWKSSCRHLRHHCLQQIAGVSVLVQIFSSIAEPCRYRASLKHATASGTLVGAPRSHRDGMYVRHEATVTIYHWHLQFTGLQL